MPPPHTRMQFMLAAAALSNSPLRRSSSTLPSKQSLHKKKGFEDLGNRLRVVQGVSQYGGIQLAPLAKTGVPGSEKASVSTNCPMAEAGTRLRGGVWYTIDFEVKGLADVIWLGHESGLSQAQVHAQSSFLRLASDRKRQLVKWLP